MVFLGDAGRARDQHDHACRQPAMVLEMGLALNENTADIARRPATYGGRSLRKRERHPCPPDF
jgi:hypothetical protein